METIAHRLKFIREQRGYKTASKAAKAFGWKGSTYMGHENGDRSPRRDTVQRYAKAYRVPVGWLLSGEGTPEKAAKASINSGLDPEAVQKVLVDLASFFLRAVAERKPDIDVKEGSQELGRLLLEMLQAPPEDPDSIDPHAPLSVDTRRVIRRFAAEL